MKFQQSQPDANRVKVRFHDFDFSKSLVIFGIKGRANSNKQFNISVKTLK